MSRNCFLFLLLFLITFIACIVRIAEEMNIERQISQVKTITPDKIESVFKCDLEAEQLMTDNEAPFIFHFTMFR